MGGATPKQFLDLAGVPILVRTVKAFVDLDVIQCAAVVLPAEHRAESEKLLGLHLPEKSFAKILFADGGVTRQDSVKAGLDRLPQEIDVVLVHDGARPMISPDVIYNCMEGAARHGAVIAAVKVKDTLKVVDSTSTIERTVDRSRLYQAQTPQAAQRQLLEQAFERAAEDNFIGTDEASLLEHAGITVHVVQGSERNLKITRPGDLELAANLVKEVTSMKIGHGFDAHRFVEGRKLIIGGVDIPFPRGLAGHSDADVLTHALIDAILGALGEGDIGRHFPDSDEKYKGSHSLKLLEQIMELAQKKNIRICNVDITVICELPKLAPYLETIKSNLARSCRTSPEAINIKATTTEQMGYTGRAEGIAAHAVVLMRS
ncbi:MAG: 2-C-methyl-D-erythritol 2,4-cyclodiphosphate synthase [Desulfobulbaceae bacterium]|nr:2-C-methyl-D-erythritol 2,4-cyclodiphosphate synthase [Desulfobulbaceae bacterium]